MVAGCGGGSTSSDTKDGQPALIGSCAPYQPYAGYNGQAVTLVGSVLAPDSATLAKAWSRFETCTGINIQYHASTSITTQLLSQLSHSQPPDLAIVPDPHSLAQLVATGGVKRPPAQTVRNAANWTSIWRSYGSIGGTLYAAPMGAYLTSLVWYSPRFFRQHGYVVPTTWTALMNLSDRIAGDLAVSGGKPWCGGLSSGTSSGWPAGDWLDAAVLGTYGEQFYDDWTSHRADVTDADLAQMLHTVASYLQDPRLVNGGHGDVASIARTSWQQAGLPILRGQCALLQQGSFYGTQWPQGTTVGPTGDVYAFPLPPVNASIGPAAVGGGEFVAAFTAAPAVQTVQNYLSSPLWAQDRISAGSGWVSANRKVATRSYADPLDRLVAGYLTDPNTTFRFTTSQLAPAGAAAEWPVLDDWFGNNTSVDTLVRELDQSWKGGE